MEEKFSIGEYIKYSSNGICVIKNIEEIAFSGNEKNKYYVMEPISKNGTVIYVPVKNNELVSKMRHIIAKNEMDDVFLNVHNKKIDWPENRKSRMELFQSIINSGDTVEVLRLSECIYNKKQQLEKDGKKLSQTDENYFKQCIAIVDEELSFVLDMDRAKIKDYIQNKMNK